MLRLLVLLAAILLPCVAKTVVTIKGDQFFINGKPTYQGRTWNGHRIEGLLMNSRTVQATFDDRNPETVSRWAYKDTGKWDAERNVREFLAALPEYRKHGLLAVTVNLQGGSPEGYSKVQPWHNSAIEADGSLRADYLGRMKRVIDKADSLGMAVILGIFYFGQDERLKDEAAVVRAVDDTVGWVKKNGWRNVLIEVNNEANVRYDHAILRPDRIHELIERVMVRQARAVPGYRSMPIVFNEDDHFNFDAADYNMLGAIREYASWGFFDPEGYQSPPVNWGLDTERKKSFFAKLKEVTGEK
jgi:hypothetical protein